MAVTVSVADEVTTAPADQVLAMARSVGPDEISKVNLPRPEGLPLAGWYEVRKANRAGGRRLYYRWASNSDGRKPDALCFCGSGRKFKACCMRVASHSLGRLT